MSKRNKAKKKMKSLGVSSIILDTQTIVRCCGFCVVSLFQWARPEGGTNVLEQTENSSVLRSVKNT